MSYRLGGTAGLMVSPSQVGREPLESPLPKMPCINAQTVEKNKGPALP